MNKNVGDRRMSAHARGRAQQRGIREEAIETEETVNLRYELQLNRGKYSPTEKFWLYNSIDARGYPTTDINSLYIERKHLGNPPPERMRLSLYLDEKIPKESVA